MRVELIGWASSLVLLPTLVKQVWKQYRTETIEGVSVTNALGLLSAIAGIYLYYRNRRRAPTS